MKHTQDELSYIWEKRTERDEHGFWDVSGFVNTSFLQAQMVTDTEMEQSFILHTLGTYSKEESDDTPVSYTRTCLNNEATCGVWRELARTI